jgi:hypothetical protein
MAALACTPPPCVSTEAEEERKRGRGIVEPRRVCLVEREREEMERAAKGGGEEES